MLKHSLQQCFIFIESSGLRVTNVEALSWMVFSHETASETVVTHFEAVSPSCGLQKINDWVAFQPRQLLSTLNFYSHWYAVEDMSFVLELKKALMTF